MRSHWSAMACMLALALLAGCVDQRETGTLMVFHAGSLAVPLREVEREFERAHPGIDVQYESYGSAEAIRQITEGGRKGDVLASADYSLIPDMMYDEYADWLVRFATNDVVLAYNPEKSRYADEITTENWYDILRRDDVTFGFSNPNLDPCGYRSLMVCQLAELYYDDSEILDDLIISHTAISVEENGDYMIKVPEDPEPDTEKVTIKPKEAELTSLVETGALDYYFIYRSVAVQSGLGFVDLPKEIDLSSVKYKDEYRRVKVETADGKVNMGMPIVYGITVPKNAESPELGLEFVQFVIGEEGQSIFARNGQPPITPPEGSGAIPEELKPLVRSILMLATGTPYELGLIDTLSEPFEKEHNCVVETTKASTGQGLDLGRGGRVDLILGHSKEALDTFMEEGYGKDRRAVMHNYFIIAGPKNDPACIRGISDLTEAHKRIADTDSLYLSRGDEGGVHKREKAIWGELGIDPSKEGWYLVSSDFMTDSLKMADRMRAYHMADSSTWTVMKGELSSLDLLVVGDPNRYEATAVNPEKHSNVNYALARAFIGYITSPEGQRIIEDFGKNEYGEPLYHPDAM